MNISLKTKVKYWFYFLRLCHLSHDPKIQSNLKKSESFYKAWGNYQTGSYEQWWKNHSKLFTNNPAPKVLDQLEPFDKNYIYLKIPLTYSPSTASKLIKLMFTKKQKETLIMDGKVKKSYVGSYKLSSLDLQTSHFDYYLRFTREVYIPLKNLSVEGTKKFKEKAIEVFRKQKVKSAKKKENIKRTIPFSELDLKKLSNLSKEDVKRISENLDRLTRRYKAISQNILTNVSLGIFPGNYEEMGTKNQIKKRKIEKEISMSPGRGPTQSKFHKKTGLVQEWKFSRNKSNGNH